MTQTIDQALFSLFSNPVPVQAFIVGIVGSLAYYTALRLGYIGGEQRTVLLDLFDRVAVIWFCLVGGCIASIFQLAQPATFAPVQALVLGVTWPTLIAQYVTAARDIEREHFIEQIRGVTEL